MNYIYKNKGITLVVLVVTIVVLLILSAVTIAGLVGNKGIIKQANEAKEETRGANVEEARDLWEIKNQVSVNKNLEDFIQELVEQELLTEDEKDEILGNESKGIEPTYKVTIGSRTIDFFNEDSNTPNPEPIEYDYTGQEQTYEVTKTGTYKIECWGASGGDFLKEDSDYVYYRWKWSIYKR